MTNKPLATIAVAVTLASLLFAACGGTTVTTSPSGDTTDGARSDLACPGGKLVGGGSTAQKLAMETLTSAYAKQCDNKGTIEYSSTGSGAGIKDFYNKQTDWAGSDSPLKTEKNADGVVEADKASARCGGNEAWNLPVIVGPIAFAYNLEGVDQLVLTPELIAKISYGQIMMWNDPAIAALNKDATLPAAKVNVFFRSDESGTTENVAKYLHKAAPSVWTDKPSKKWPGKAGEGKKGTQGVADGVKATAGGFGVMEWKYAKDSGLGISAIDNGAGAVELTAASVSKDVETAEVTGSGNNLSLTLKYTDTAAGVYPAVLVTYEIVCSAGGNQATTPLLKDFLTYVTSEDTQAGLEDLGYAPLPADLRTKVAAAVAAMT